MDERESSAEPQILLTVRKGNGGRHTKRLVDLKFRNSHLRYHHQCQHGRNRTIITKVAAGKKDQSGNKDSRTEFKLGNAVLARSAAVAVLGLGFVDAGYSGDWSRIGAISKETEELLKAATFLVVPLCIVLILFLINHSKENEA